jgi:hypothetical protein
MESLMIKTKSDCIIDLTMSYGKSEEIRFLDAIAEKEKSLGRRLSREEILKEYRALDDELFPMLITRRGK